MNIKNKIEWDFRGAGLDRIPIATKNMHFEIHNFVRIAFFCASKKHIHDGNLLSTQNLHAKKLYLKNINI